ncbi:MAG: phosphopentomutase, partial [Arenicellales bacterium]|nr:phosphopentomutase [Arenicellales bacterium]
CAEGNVEIDGEVRSGLKVPSLCALGLAHAATASRGSWPAGLPQLEPQGAWGYAVEQSAGKDTPSGHWEMAGLPVMTDWGYFPNTTPCFPSELTNALIQKAELKGLLGNCHASGTAIIDELGAEHIQSSKPICYTSAESVFQLAAHETHFGLDRLYAVCKIARNLVDQWNLGRVIARPFLGEEPDDFFRTENRRDYTTPPPSATLLDRVKASDGDVIAIGKISDIYAGQGVTDQVKASGNMTLFDETLNAMRSAKDRSLIFTNFVDFDMLYGHRRDVAGYAAALEAFDRRLPELFDALSPGDLVIATADHGCDPTASGHDHTREHVPVLAFGPDVRPVDLGQRESFADMGETLAEHLGVAPFGTGKSFLSEISA